MDTQLVNTWEIHNRINLYVLDAISDAALTGISASKGRSVAEEFAHMHNVRLMWLQSAAPELMEGLAKVEKDQAANKALLARSLEESGRAIADLLAKAIETGRVKGFKPHATAFVGYLISHESYHVGEIGIILAQSGHPLDTKVSYGMWEWGVR